MIDFQHRSAKQLLRLRFLTDLGYSSTLSLALTVLLASVLTLLFWNVLPAAYRINESSDYTSFYEPVARNVLADKGFVADDGSFAMRYPPTYPIILAALYGLARLVPVSEETLLALFTLFCMASSAVFILLMARRFWHPSLALLSSVAWCTYPVALWMTKQPNSELPFWPAFFAAIYLYLLAHEKRSNAPWLFVAIGILLGIAMLIRPIALGLPLVIAASVCFTMRHRSFSNRLLLGFILLTATLFTILPWQFRIYNETGQVLLLSSGSLSSVRDGLTFGAIDKDYREGGALPGNVRTLMMDIAARGQFSSFADITTLLIQELRDRPVTVLTLFGIKALRSWYATDSNRLEGVNLVIQVFYLLAIAGGTAVALKQDQTVRRFTISIWFIVLYFWLMTTSVLSILRYMVPVMGLLMIFVPGVLAHWLRLTRSTDCVR